MEGQQVGDAVVGGAQGASAVGVAPLVDDFNLVWPEQLIEDLAAARRKHWATPLAIASFILAALMGVMLGPVQLILLVLTGNAPLVTDDYYPMVMRIALILSGLIAASASVAMIQTWREQPKRTLMTLVFGAGAILLVVTAWLAAFVIAFQPIPLTIVMVLLIFLTGFGAFATYKNRLSPEMPQKFYHIAIAAIVALGAVETMCSMVYVFSQSNNAERNQAEIEALGRAQAAARINGITPALSDLVFTICDGAYDAVYIPSKKSDTGLFECRGSSGVYSVTGPSRSQSESVMLGAAFYFGKTYDEAISKYFPPTSGAKYFYRNIADMEVDNVPNDLVMLLPASSEEILVNAYLDGLLGVINDRYNDGVDRDLQLNLFYNEELNTVVSTKDFILIAVRTMAQTKDLPGGTQYKGYLNGAYGTYIYSADLNVAALTELGESPLLYSSQTRNAINSKRHITVLIKKGREYTADELRELLYAGFVEPVQQ